MVLRGTYGDKLHQDVSRVAPGPALAVSEAVQPHVYVDAFETILFVETTFGTQLRDHAIRISRERYTLRQELTQLGFQIRGASMSARTDPEFRAGAVIDE